MPVFEIVAAILYAATVYGASMAITYLVMITLDVFFNWFDEFLRSHSFDANQVGFTIEQAIKDGQVNYIQGVFNKRTNQVVAGRQIQGKHRDAQVSQMHNQKPVVIYN